MVASARVAVILPCCNDGPLLLEALASIREPEPVEVVVVDDCSTDLHTLHVLERLSVDGLRVVRHQVNRGLSEARNTGLASTRAPFVFPLDSDDLAVSGALACMADRLDADPEAVCCFGDYQEFGTHEIVRAVPSTLDPFRIAYVNEYPVTALFRRSVLQEVGGWRTIGAGYEDWDLWMTFAEHDLRGVYMGPGVLTFRKRFHGQRMLTRAKREHRALYRALRERHPGLFSEIRRYRRVSDLRVYRKLLYPFVYGDRRRFAFEPRIKRWLDWARLWTLRR